MADSKWGGIRSLAEKLRHLAYPSYGKGSAMDQEMEAELHRRIEPLLEAAKEVHCPTSTLTEINRLRRLQEEVDKWRK